MPEPAPPLAAAAPAAAVDIPLPHRPYFLAAIATVLTAGASWGAWLLWSIGFAGDFTGISLHHVNAHGHAQIFGWVGLFVMGFGYQMLPRLWHAPAAAPRGAGTALGLMLSGLVLRTAGMSAPAAGWAPPAALGGGALEIAAIGVFAGHLAGTLRAARRPLEPWAAFVLAGLGFFVLQAVLSVWHMHRLMIAPDRDALVAQVATWQAPLRDLQVHGLALCMILGVNLRLLPILYDRAPAPTRRAWIAFGLVVGAICGEVTLFLAYRISGSHHVAALLLVPWLMLAAGCLLIGLSFRFWKPMVGIGGGPCRSAKFIRAAWGWLALSLGMLLLLPAYQAASGIPFSHAYYGAIRHAITVGFVSLMIMGIAARIVPMLADVDHRTLPGLWAPFVLVNLGCLLRVSTQTLTNWHPLFFGVIGVSGMLEVAGLALWGAHLAAVMLGSRSLSVFVARPRLS